ncbi:MAG: rane protein TerC family [Labilithrix sp.]|nr:rane protein TerC family [Labilithrix sp.]
MDAALALLMLTGMEIVLGIDNIIFLSILVGALPREQQKHARYIGLGLALGARMGLLLGIRWVMGLDKALFHLSSLGFIPEAWLQNIHVNAVTGRDLVLFGGGLFLITKSVVEIHKKMAGEDEHGPAHAPGSFAAAIAQIIVLDVVFSLDSIISAIGMVQQVWIMIVAMTIAVAFMAFFAGKISRFIDKHPTFKMLALSFLVLIGVVLIAEGMGTHIPRGYIYVSMAFSLGVELLNTRVHSRRAKRAAKKRATATATEPAGDPAHNVV